MRVGFDVAPLHVPHSRGLRRVCQGLVSALERRARLDVVRLSPPDGTLLRWRQLELPKEVRRNGLVGIHSCTSAFPVRGPGARVQTIHELPWLHGVTENADWIHRLWARLGPLRADRVVVPTEHVARGLARFAWGGRDRIRAVPWGFDPRFAEEAAPGVIDEAVLERHRLGDMPYVLAPGADRAKKNLAGLLDGFAELERRGERRLRLVVTASDTPDLRRDLGRATRLGLAHRVSTLEEVAEEELPSLVRLAEAVSVLSHSEGFGLSVLEALACATPVLVPRASAQAEVAGDAGIVCDPADPTSVADALERAVAERESSRPVLVARAANFTWDACAERIEALWSELA